MTYAVDSLGKKQFTLVTCTPNTAGVLNGKYFTINSSKIFNSLLSYAEVDSKVVVWYNSDSSGSQPTVTGANRYIQVNIASNDSDVTIASKTSTAINADLGFSSYVLNNQIVVNATISGQRVVSSVGTTSFTISTIQLGTMGFAGGYDVNVSHNVKGVDPVYSPITGFIYYSAYGDNLLVVDPTNNSYHWVTLPAGVEQPVVNEQARWAGSCLAPNGKIYMPPYASNQILVIDPSKAETDAGFITHIDGAGHSQASGAGGQFGCFVGSILVGNKIYCSPMDDNVILCIDTTNDTFTRIALSGISQMSYDTYTGVSNGWKWGFGAQGDDGILYFAPHVGDENGGNGTGSILAFNPSNNTYQLLATPVTNTSHGDGMFWGAAKSPNGNGKIYFSPYGGTSALVLNTKTSIGTMYLLPVPGIGVGNDTIFGNFQGGFVGSNGHLFYTPARSTFMLEIDPNDDSIIPSATGVGIGVTTAVCGGGCEAPNGIIYAGPYYSNCIPIFSTSFPSPQVSVAYQVGNTISIVAPASATIYYTLDGTTPTISSAVYSGPISFSGVTTIKYFSVYNSGTIEPVQASTFNPSSTQIQTGKASIKNITKRFQTGKASISKISKQFISGKASLLALRIKTIAGKSKITANSLQINQGKASVKNTSLQIAQGISNIQPNYYKASFLCYNGQRIPIATYINPDSSYPIRVKTQTGQTYGFKISQTMTALRMHAIGQTFSLQLA